MTIDHDLWSTIPHGEGIDDAARTYAAGMHNKPYEHYRNKVADFSITGDRMLDAGCGTGTWSLAATEFFKRIDGCDISEGRIAVARAMAEKLGLDKAAHFQVADVLQLPFEHETFDFVFCYSVVISYIPISILLQEFHRVLKPGGRILINLNGNGWSKYLRDVRGANDEKTKTVGLRGIYNTLMQSRGRISPDEIRKNSHLLSRNDKLKRIQKIDNYLGAPISLLSELGWPELLSVGNVVQEECGDDYLRTFADDVVRMMAGSRDNYSHAKAGRGYIPEEVDRFLTAIGYKNFRWAQEGRLFGETGENGRGNLYKNELTTWDFIAEKRQ